RWIKAACPMSSVQSCRFRGVRSASESRSLSLRTKPRLIHGLLKVTFYFLHDAIEPSPCTNRIAPNSQGLSQVGAALSCGKEVLSLRCFRGASVPTSIHKHAAHL